MWQFGLYPVDERQTRLISRNRANVPRTVRWTLFMCLLEPVAFIMTRKMLLGIKRRAEAMARMPTSVRRELEVCMTRKILLVCGPVSSILYVAMTVLVAMQWDAYSSASQTVSELSAIGAPTRALWVLPGAFYTILVTAFGWGLWQSSGRNRALQTVGGLIMVYGALGLAWPFAPMHLREVLATGGGTFSDTMHIVLASVTVGLMLLAMGVGAAALGERFRLYSIVSLAILTVCGALTFLDAPRIAANLPTPWIGIWERINIGVFLLWVSVLATALLRVHASSVIIDRHGAVAA